MREVHNTDRDSRDEHRIVRILRLIGSGLLSVGSVLACMLMVCLFVVGFLLILKAFWGNRDAWWGIGPASPSHSSISPDSRQITVAVLHGLEFFFLAPLPALVFLSLARFFRSFQTSDNAENSRNDESRCAHQLHRVKALVISLMIASIATDLLGKALQGISLEMAIAESLVMLLLGAYWFSLEKVCSRNSGGGHSEASLPRTG
jgi:hypothetical protein